MAKRQKIELHEALSPYVDILRRFIRGELELTAFEKRFNALYLSGPGGLSPDAFYALDGFFSDVDNCVPPPDEPDPKFREITPDELRERAIALLRDGGYDT